MLSAAGMMGVARKVAIRGVLLPRRERRGGESVSARYGCLNHHFPVNFLTWINKMLSLRNQRPQV